MISCAHRTSNHPAAGKAGIASLLAIGHRWPGLPEPGRSMKTLLTTVVGIMLIGCGPPPPVPKKTHIQQVQRAVAKAGGETNIANESRTLFTRLSQIKNPEPFYTTEDQRLFHDLLGITNLGDVFHYAAYEPDRIHIRIHNSHFDTYFIDLLNPDRPEPKGFERIVGNIGFIEPNGAANGSQPIRSETNRTSSAAGSRR
jgi:hypothetical protein